MGAQRLLADRMSETQIKQGLPRACDALVALCALGVGAPLVGLAALAVALTSGRPVLFRQTRVGQHGRPFTLYKLRTMRVATGGAQVTAAGDARVTRVGRILRQTKLDEWPGLWNVVRGDMALVGPRPEVPRYVVPASAAWRLVLRARPGLTDPVTLRLRNEEALLATIEGDREQFYLTTLQPYKLAGYAAYLRERSWLGDLKILWATALAVVRPHKAPPPTLAEVLAQGRGGAAQSSFTVGVDG